MRLIFIYSLFVVCLGVSSGQSASSCNNQGSKSNSNLANQNAFNIELLNAVSATRPGNVLIGSSSVKAALMVLAEAAAGKTRQQIISSLKLPNDSNEIRKIGSRTANSFGDARSKTELRTAVKLWLKKGVVPAGNFMNILQQYYRSESETIDFTDASRSTNTVNSWVKKSTNGLIDSIVEPNSLERDTQALLTTAVYFKGTWSKSFDKQKTTAECFDVPGVGCQKVPTMTNEDTYKYGYFPEHQFGVVQIPYTGDRVAMLVILPNKELKNGLDDVSKKLETEPLPKILSELGDETVNLRLPKFSISNKIQLADNLKRLKITDLFGENANLKTAFPRENLKVSAVYHNARIEVDEEGTTAAASTGATLANRFNPTILFHANRPFIFFLLDLQTNDILFAGRYVKPEDQPDLSC